MSRVAENIDEMIDRHREWLLRVIAAHTKNKDMIDDVLAEVFLAVAKSSDQPQANTAWEPWLCKIAVRQSALANRRAMRQQRLSDRYAQVSSVDESEHDPILWLLAQERTETVREVLGEIESEMRSVLIDKYVQKLTYAQLGERLGVADHVAEYRVARAKKQLRARLIQRGFEKEDLK